MSEQQEKVQVMDARMSCDCIYKKEFIESTIVKELQKIFFNRHSQYHGEKLSKENLDDIEQWFKDQLRWEFDPFDRTGPGFVVLECQINMDNPEIDKFPILIHQKPTNQLDRSVMEIHEAIHYDGIMKIGQTDQVIKVSVVVRDDAYYDRNDVDFLDDDSLDIED